MLTKDDFLHEHISKSTRTYHILHIDCIPMYITYICMYNTYICMYDYVYICIYSIYMFISITYHDVSAAV